ncbi:venom protease isoform X2 [Frankliniella occidentalis]|uniref:Venom protease isoform X2 n=1 Tax=Frankliniella occidentalis TaxID=133901 RepID=A0A9C6WYZ2_FRAOC|nr:venom protease isoform X2 [Frankliniella occidentalis]
MLACLLVLALAGLAQAQQQLYEGSKCETAAGAPGICKRLTSCPWAVEEVKRGRRPKICFLQGPWPFACCPGTSATTPAPAASSAAQVAAVGVRGRVAKSKCEEYAEYVFAEVDSPVLMLATERQDLCARSVDPLIVGGSLAKAMEFPHMALIGYGDEPSIDWLCGGSLISKNFVLTAGHCLVAGDREARWVLLGELDYSTEADDAQPQRLRIAQTFKHPGYRPPSTYNDIALLRLERNARMSGYVRPACLYTEPTLRPRAGNEKDELPVATGWGNTDWVGDASSHLLKVALRVSEPAACKKAFSSVTKIKLPQGINTEMQLCAGGSGLDTCQGDSGGPLQVAPKNYSRDSVEPYCMWKIVGITSFGQACGGGGVYSRVYHFLPWIEGIVWPGGE